MPWPYSQAFHDVHVMPAALKAALAAAMLVRAAKSDSEQTKPFFAHALVHDTPPMYDSYHIAPLVNTKCNPTRLTIIVFRIRFSRRPKLTSKKKNQRIWHKRLFRRCLPWILDCTHTELFSWQQMKQCHDGLRFYLQVGKTKQEGKGRKK